MGARSDFKNRISYKRKLNGLKKKEKYSGLDFRTRPSVHNRKKKRIALNRVYLISELCDKEIPRVVVNVPEVFCLLEQPAVAMEFLAYLEDLLFVRKARHVLISHVETRKIGLAASILFDEKFIKAERYWIEKGSKLIIFGFPSASKRVNNFLAAFGTLSSLKINLNQVSGFIDENFRSHFNHFKAAGNKNIPAAKSNACTQLLDYFNNCFAYIDLKLTEPARDKLHNAFSEVLGNAEEHAGEMGDWRLVGFFDVGTKACNFVFINEGPTIYETLSGADKSLTEVIGAIEDVIKSHRSILEKAKAIWEDDVMREPIWNVMALQEGISSKRNEDPTRGRGMSDVLEFISDIRGLSGDANIVIISGHSHIDVDFRYPLAKVDVQVGPKMERWRRISFNTENDLKSLQDKDKVQYIKDKFQGTIIAGRFVVSNDYILDEAGR